MQLKQTNLAQLQSSEDLLASMGDLLESSKRVQGYSKEILESIQKMKKQSDEATLMTEKPTLMRETTTLRRFTVFNVVFLSIALLELMFSLNAQELNVVKLALNDVFTYIGEETPAT
ncbi:uncharacterized protein PG986_002244 [Apiospora aurea]|uniref:Uncharacterized protein n=1 Tax=Apiospora aurea TaxID=335848 RepID=A0ABR1QZS0_9PEZI